LLRLYGIQSLVEKPIALVEGGAVDGKGLRSLRI